MNKSWFPFFGEEEKKSVDEFKNINIQTATRDELIFIIKEQKESHKTLEDNFNQINLNYQEEKQRLLVEQELRIKSGLELDAHERRIQLLEKQNESLKQDVDKYSHMLDIEIIRTKTLEEKANGLQAEISAVRQIEAQSEAEKNRLKSSSKAQLVLSAEAERTEKWKIMEQLQKERNLTASLKEKNLKLESEKAECKVLLDQEKLAKNSINEKYAQLEKEKIQLFSQLSAERISHTDQFAQIEREYTILKQEADKNNADRLRVVAQLEKASQELQAQLQMVYQLKNEKEKLTDKVKTMESEYFSRIRNLESEKESQSQSLTEKNDKLLAEKTQLQKQLSQATQQVSQLTTTTERQEEQIKRLQESNSNFIAEIRNVESKSAHLVELLRNVKSTDSKVVIEKLHQEKERIIDDLRSAEEKISNLKHMNSVLEEEKIKIQQAQQDVNKILREQLQSEIAEKDNLYKKIETLENEKSDLLEKIKADQSQHESFLLQKETEFNDKSQSFSKEISDLKKMIGTLESEIAQEKCNVAEMKELYQNELKQKEKVQEDYKTEQSTNTYLVNELSSEKTLRKQISEELKLQKQNQEALLLQIETMQETNRGEQEKLKENISILENKVKEIEKEIETKNTTISSMHTEEEWVDKNEKFVRQQDLLGRAGGHIKELKQNIKKSAAEINTLKNSNTEFLKRIETHESEKKALLETIDNLTHFEKNCALLEEQLNNLQSELQNEKKAHAADLSTLEQYKARENVVKMMQANYSGRDSSVNFETISVELENKIKDVEKTILRIAHAEKDFQLKEQNLFKSRERYMERLKANMKDKQTASFLELTNLQGRKEIEMIIHKAEQYQQLLEESEQMATHLLIQNKHLKEEIRNIERNETREKNFKNLEYLKNITLKYIQTHHEQLIPVIANLLQFSPEEMDSIKPNPSRPLSPKSPASPPSKSYFWF